MIYFLERQEKLIAFGAEVLEEVREGGDDKVYGGKRAPAAGKGPGRNGEKIRNLLEGVKLRLHDNVFQINRTGEAALEDEPDYRESDFPGLTSFEAPVSAESSSAQTSSWSARQARGVDGKFFP